MQDPKLEEHMLDKELQFLKTRVGQSRAQLSAYRDLNANLLSTMTHSEEVFREYFSLQKPTFTVSRNTNSHSEKQNPKITSDSPISVLQTHLSSLQQKIAQLQREMGPLLLQDDEQLKQLEKLEYKVSKRRDKLEKELKGWEKARKEGWHKVGKLQDEVLERGGNLFGS